MPGIYDHVQRRKLLLAQSKALTHHTLHPIAVDRAAGGADADREPEAGVIEAVRTRDHGEEGVGHALALTVDAVELWLVA